MTQATQNDPWAAAQAYTAPQQAPQTYAPPAGQQYGGGEGGSQASSLAGSFAPQPGSGSQLFAPQGESLPALFTLTHAPGTEFRGKILSAPRDVQSTSYPRTPGDPRLPLFWTTDPQGKRVPGPAPIDPITGKPNDKVMDTVVELQTDARLTPEERARTGRQDYQDDGRRIWQISGSKRPKGHELGKPTNSMRALLDAIEIAVKSGIKITDEESMVGLYLTVKRVQRVQPGVGTSPWTFVARLEK